MEKADCLLLLGAGASVPLGYKSMSEFCAWVDTTIPGYKQRVASLWNSLREHLPEDQRGDLEELFGVVAALANSSLKTAIPALREIDARLEGFTGISEDAHDLEWWLRRAVFLEYSRPEDWRRIASLYDELLEMIVNRVMTKNVDGITQWHIPLYTTNYEPSLREACARRTDFGLGTPIDGFGPYGPWSRHRLDCGLLAPLAVGQETPGILVIHLHGCVTWLRYQDGTLRREGRPAFCDPAEGRELMNEVLYPHEKLFRQPEPYATHFSMLRRHLSEVEVAIVIGLEFRKTDSLILSALQEGLERGLRLISVNPRYNDSRFADDQMSTLLEPMHEKRRIQVAANIVFLPLGLGYDPGLISAIAEQFPS